MHEAWPRSVTAVLPAFNESAVIAGLVRRTDAVLAGARLDGHEVVVVDDGSTDHSGTILDGLTREIGALRVVHHPVNRGYGAALRSGFDAARSEAIWLMDGDGQFDPADVHRLLERAGPDTLVAGYRERRQDPLMRRLNHDAFFSVVRMAFGPTARDVNCAFKLFPRRAGQGLHADGAMISTELIIRARQSNMALVEVSIPHHRRRTGSPTGANVHVVVRAFRELARMRGELRSTAIAGSGGAPDGAAPARRPRDR
jgi:glycosyltransferase involved in cell wall biosynthesis